MMENNLSNRRNVEDFLPLIIIFSVIGLFTALMQFFIGGSDLDFGMRMFMGAFFLVFGSFKLFNLKKFAEAYRMYDLLAMRYKFYSFLYPFIELALALLYLADLGGVLRDGFTLVLMLVSVAGVMIKLRKKETIPCACLGMVFVLPMTWVTLVEDMLMAIEALFMFLMPIAFQMISTEKLSTTLDLHLMVHDSSEWVRNSQWGHWVVGFIMVLFVLSSFLERRRGLKKGFSLVFIKNIVPVLLVVLGFLLSIYDTVHHAIFDDFDAVVELIQMPSSQWFQHFAAGLLLVIAGISEWRRTRHSGSDKLKYVAPAVVLATGIGFFFHQQLGALDAVVNAMIWHMSFGALLVVGAVMRILDLLFFEERKTFFVIWAVTLLVAFSMMTTYREPPGAYEKATAEQKIEFQEKLELLQEEWSLF